jgi:hypothetical protein
MLQHVGCRLNRSLAHLVHANFVSAVPADHRGVARNVSSRFVHALRLRSIGGQCRGHWDSDHGLRLLRVRRMVSHDPIPTDLKLMHLEGRMLMLEGIAAGLPKDDKRLLIRSRMSRSVTQSSGLRREIHSASLRLSVA